MAEDDPPPLGGGLIKGVAPRPPFDESSQNYEAVGRLITAYANAEGALHQLARHLTGLSDEKARVLFAGMRVSDITDRVRALVRLNKTDSETAADIEACLVQLNEIASRRHSLVHRGSIFVFGVLLVNNVSTAKTMEGIEQETFRHAELKDMTSDCENIYLRLTQIVRPIDGSPEFSAGLRQPWRYKPARPKAQNQSRQKGSGSQKPPPDASQG
jgi:hypothetical protein